MLGSSADAMDIEKNDGAESKGIIYEFIIPYSNVIYFKLYPVLRSTLVSIMGSRKNPIDDISLTDVVGMEIDIISFIISFFIIALLFDIYLFFIVWFIIIILIISVITLNSIRHIMAIILPFLINIGSSMIINSIFTISSTILDIPAGIISSFPCKNPLCMLDIVTNGIIGIMDKIALYRFLLCSILAIVFENMVINIINIILTIIPTIYEFFNKSLLLYLFSALNLLMDIGKLN